MLQKGAGCGVSEWMKSVLRVLLMVGAAILLIYGLGRSDTSAVVIGVVLIGLAAVAK